MNDVTQNTVSEDSKNMAFLMYILSIFFGFIPSLVMFLTKKDDEFIYKNSIELLNFAITMTILFFGIMFVNVIIAFIPVIGFLISMILSLLLAVLGIGALVLLIMGAIKVKEGEYYSFPFAVRLIK